MGPQEDYIETVFTCEGDFNDPHLQDRLEDFQRGLKDLLLTDTRKLILKKVEPWNSVRVTFNIPCEAALRLKQLAQQGNTTLRSLGVLAVQIQGDQLISLTIAGRNNERTELIFRTTNEQSYTPDISVFDSSLHVTDELHSPIGHSNVETTRKNIADYLRQGTLFDSLLAQEGSNSNTFKSPNVVATSCEPIPFRPNNVIQSCGVLTKHNSIVQGQPTGLLSGHCLSSHTISADQTVKLSSASLSPVAQPSLKVSSSLGLDTGMSTSFPSGLFNSQPSQRNEMLFSPLPQGSNLVNNFQKAFKAATSTSPLLVNLLQTDPNATINSFLGAKMPPPLEESPPPVKRKRKPRKPKDKISSKPLTPIVSEEISIQSVPNPALNSHGVPSAASGNNSQILGNETSLSLPVSQLNAPYTSHDHQISFTFTDSLELSTNNHSQHGQEPLTDSANSLHMDVTSQDTVRKIVNPYTGLLEPVENLSDSSPGKCDSYKDQSPFSSPLKMNESKILSRSETTHQVECTLESSPVSARASSSILASRVPHVYSTASGNIVSSNSCVSLSINPSHLALVSTSSHVFASQPNIPMHSSHSCSSPHSLNSPVPNEPSTLRPIHSSITVDSPKQNQQYLALKRKSDIQNLAVYPFTSYPHTISLESRKHLMSVATSDTICKTTISGKSAYPISQTGKNANVLHSDKINDDGFQRKIQDSVPEKCVLDNAHTFFSKTENSDNQVVGSPNCRVPSDGDSENSSQGSVSHDVQLPSDIGSLQNEPSLESALKPYNHDSGVGSSSERSDDTPSEPGDADFKAGHTLPEDCMKLNLLCDKQAKTDANLITVGYTLSENDTLYNRTELTSGLSVDPSKSEVKIRVNSENYKKHSNTVSEGSRLLSNLVNSSVRKTPITMYANVLSEEVGKLAHTSVVESIALPKKDAGFANEDVGLLHNKFAHDDIDSPVSIGRYQQGDKQPSVNFLSTLPVLRGEKTIDTCTTSSLQKFESIDSHVSTSCPPSQYSGSIPVSDSLHGPEYVMSSKMSQRIQDTSSMHQTLAKVPHSIKHSTLQKSIKSLDDSALLSKVYLDSLEISNHNLTNSRSANMSKEEAKNIDEMVRNPDSSLGHSLSEINFSILENHASGKVNTYNAQSQCAQLPHRNISCNKETSVAQHCNDTGSVSILENTTTVPSLYSVSCSRISCSGENNIMNSTIMESTNSSNSNVKLGTVSKPCANVQDPPKSNITSMYTRRSSPINSSVNTLNCYDPALPLPKRLTESIQKLVKPLMTLDSSTLNQRKSPISSIPKSGTLSSSSKGSPRFGIGSTRHSVTTGGGTSSPYDLIPPVSSSTLGLGCKMVGIDSSNCEDILPGIGLTPLSSLSGELCVNEHACPNSVVLSASSQSTYTAPVVTPTTLHAIHVSNAYSFAANSLPSLHCDKANVTTSTVLNTSQPAAVSESVSCQLFSGKLCMRKESDISTSCDVTLTNAYSCNSQSIVQKEELSEIKALTTQEHLIKESLSQCGISSVSSSVNTSPTLHFLDPLTNLSKSQYTDCVLNHDTRNDCDQNREKISDQSCTVDQSLKEERCIELKQKSMSGIEKNELQNHTESTFWKKDFAVKHNNSSNSVLVTEIMSDETKEDNVSDKVQIFSDLNTNVIECQESTETIDSQIEAVNSSEIKNYTTSSVSLQDSWQHMEIDDLDVKSHRIRRTSESSEGSLQLSGNTRALRACRKRVSSAEQNIDEDPENDKCLRSCRRKKNVLNNSENIELYDKPVKVDTENKKDVMALIDSKNKDCFEEDPNFSKNINTIDDGNTESQTLIDTVKSGLRVRANVRNAHIDDLAKTNISTKDLKKDLHTPVNKLVLEKNVKLTEEDAISRRGQIARRCRQSDKLASCYTREKSPIRGTRRGRNSPNVEQQEDMQKRSTRSSKQKADISDIPPSKRRKSSRDHK